jgi:hypothetical protein
MTGTPLAAVVDLNSPGHYLNWSIFTVSVASLAIIAVMVVIFAAALLIPFPDRGGREETPERPPTGDGLTRGHGDGLANRRPGRTPAPPPMTETTPGRAQCGGPASASCPRQTAPRPAAGLRRLMDLCVRSGRAGRPLRGHRVGLRHRPGWPGLVAHRVVWRSWDHRAKAGNGLVPSIESTEPVGNLVDH